MFLQNIFQKKKGGNKTTHFPLVFCKRKKKRLKLKRGVVKKIFFCLLLATTVRCCAARFQYRVDIARLLSQVHSFINVRFFFFFFVFFWYTVTRGLSKSTFI